MSSIIVVPGRIVEGDYSYGEHNLLSCTSSIDAVKLHWLYAILLYTVTDRDIFFFCYPGRHNDLANRYI
jgi:hypothetical protein